MSGNTALNGGGIYNEESAVVTCTNSAISDNRASDSGAGLYNLRATVTLTGCTVQ